MTPAGLNSHFSYVGDPDFKHFADLHACVAVWELAYGVSPTSFAYAFPAPQVGAVVPQTFTLPNSDYRHVIAIRVDFELTGPAQNIANQINLTFDTPIATGPMSTLYNDYVVRKFNGVLSTPSAHSLYVPFALRAPQTERIGDAVVTTVGALIPQGPPPPTLASAPALVVLSGIPANYTVTVKPVFAKTDDSLDFLRTVRRAIVL